MREKWLGGNMNFPGGGYKIRLLRKEIEPLKDKNDLIIFTDRLETLTEF